MKKKGFTLTELIATIGILALLIVIGVATFINVRSNVLKKDYENLVTRIETASEAYARDTGITYVSVETLIKDGYLDPDDTLEEAIYNPQNEESLNCYFVNINYNDGIYAGTFQENSELRKEDGTCDNYQASADLVIYANMGGKWEEVNNQAWYGQNVVLEVRKVDGSELTDENATYEWRSEQLGLSLSTKSIETNITPGTTSLATYRATIHYKVNDTAVVGQAVNAVRIDLQAPTITGVDVENRETWTNKDKKVTITTTDYSGSGVSGIYVGTNSDCKNVTYKPISNNTYTEELDNGTYFVCAKDEVGNVTENPYEFTVSMIDKVPPTCSVDVTSGTIGKNNWYTSNIVLTLTTADEGGSGVSKYDITNSSRASYSNRTSYNQSDTNGTTIYGYVMDVAGNISSCSTAVKVDTIDPTCNITPSGTNGDNGWFKSNVNMSLTTNDSGSGIMNYGLIKSTNRTYNSSTSLTESNNGTYTYYGYVEDRAGRIGSCSSTIKIDKIAPTCSIAVSGTQGANSWYTTNATLTLSTADTGTSNVASYDLTTSSSASYNKNSSSTQRETTGTRHYGYVKDGAGNTSSCYTDVKVDTTNPTVSSFNITSQKNYNSTSAKLSIGSSDATSKIAAYCYTTSNNSNTCTWRNSTNNTYTTNYTFSGNEGSGTSYTLYAFVKDNAGRISSVKSTTYTLYTTCSSTTQSGGGSWGSCSNSCGWGTQYRTINYNDTYLGTSCSSSQDSQSCYEDWDCWYDDGYDDWYDNSSSSTTDDTCYLCMMQENSENWWDPNYDGASLHGSNSELAEQYEQQTGIHLSYDEDTGYWNNPDGSHAYEVSGSGKR